MQEKDADKVCLQIKTWQLATSLLGLSLRFPRSVRRRKNTFACFLYVYFVSAFVETFCVPRFSQVFDPHATRVCGFCFAHADRAAAATTHVLQLRKKDGRLKVLVAERTAGGELRAVLNGCAPGSVNEGAGIEHGDVVVSVCGNAMTPGAGALDRCLAALAGSGTKDGEVFPIVVSRENVVACAACARFATCAACRAKGRLGWHKAHECVATAALPAAATKGETSPLRMMLRYRATADHGDWAPTCLAPNRRGPQ